MGKSWSTTIMQDQRIAVEEAGVIAGVESVLAMPSSVAVGAGAEVGDVKIQQYTPEVQRTIGKLIESVDIVSQETIPTLFESFNIVTSGLVESFGQVITQTAGTFGQSLSTVSEATGKASELLGEKLQETQLGQAAILPGIAKYLLIAAVVIIVAGKVWK